MEPDKIFELLEMSIMMYMLRNMKKSPYSLYITVLNEGLVRQSSSETKNYLLPTNMVATLQFHNNFLLFKYHAELKFEKHQRNFIFWIPTSWCSLYIDKTWNCKRSYKSVSRNFYRSILNSNGILSKILLTFSKTILKILFSNLNILLMEN